MNINIYKTKEELSDKLSDYIIKAHLNNSIALSGGSTPILLFKNLNNKLANHNREYPYSIPDKIHRVTVPGPIKADVTIRPGPMFFKALSTSII